MKVKSLIFLLVISVVSFAQSWQGKPVVRIENKTSSFLYTFSDSSNAYIQKQNISYIVNAPNSVWVQVGYMYDGSTSRIITCNYSALTQPALASAKILTDTLNAWLNEPSTGGGGSGGVQSVVAGTNITVDNTDPENPIVSSTGGGENLQQTINNGSNITNPSIIVSNLNAGSPVDGVAFIIYPDTTNNTVSSFAYSNDFTHITGSQTKAIVGTNLQLVQMGIYDETSTLDTADLKLMFVNNAGVEKAYFTGLTTNNNTDKFIGVNSATKEIYEIDTSFYVSKNYLNSIGLGSVTSVATGYGLSGGPITTSGTLLVDTSNIASKTYVNSKVASSGGSSSLSSLTAATATNTIDNKAYQQTWKWDSLSSGTGMKISTASTLASGNTQTLFEIEQTGTNATSSLKTYATKIKSTKSSNSISNVALYLEASGVSYSGTSNSRALEIGGGEIYINTGGTTNPYFRFASGAAWSDNTVGLQTFNAPAGTNTGFSFAPNSVYGINFQNHFSSTAGFGFSNYSSTRNAMLFGAQGYFASYYAQQASAVVLERDKDVFSISADSATGSTFFTPTKILSVRGKTTNVGIGTQLPDASAILDLTSTTKGFLPPRMTSTQGSALTPIEGLLIYVTDTNGTFTSKGWWGYNGSAWEKLNN